jgi:hypothetical protein
VDLSRVDMQKLTLRVYLREIALQCRFALTAFEALEHEVQMPTNLEEARGMGLRLWRGQLDWNERVFYYLQALLTAAANVSRFLWPMKPMSETAATRGNELRQLLEVSERMEESVVGNRFVRNGFEHFDKEIDEALKHGIIADLKVVSTGDQSTWDTVAKQYKRIFNGGDLVAMFDKHEIHLLPLVEELQRLAVLATELAQAPIPTL